MTDMLPLWICCQLGAREHYAIPRALYQGDRLQCLLTDAWTSPQSRGDSLLSKVSSGLKERCHPDLTNAPIQAFTPSLLQFELLQRWRKTGNWERMMQRNQWFQRQVLRYLQANLHQFSPSTVLFSYSYTALSLFQFAKQQGWKTVLGQIDPGPVEEQLVAEEQRRHPGLEPIWQPVPPSYWQTWRQECALADEIIVNSDWSKRLLTQADLEPANIRVVPLVYEPPQAARAFCRTYPKEFSSDRPLRVLFLGTVTLRKGIAPLLAAIAHLQDAPIEFWMVGSLQITIPPHLRQHPKIRWLGAVPRSETQHYYQSADVFLFPTLSDGFGLTQLEARSWQLPIIASSTCGTVVEPGKNGLLLPEVTPEAIVDALRWCLEHPQHLTALAHHADSIESFSLHTLRHHLESLFNANSAIV